MLRIATTTTFVRRIHLTGHWYLGLDSLLCLQSTGGVTKNKALARTIRAMENHGEDQGFFFSPSCSIEKCNGH